LSEQTTPSRGPIVLMGIAAALIFVIAIVLVIVIPTDEESSPVDDTPTQAEEIPEGSFSFDGTLNYDMPTPSRPIPKHQFSLASEAQVTFEFTIDPVWEDCGFWWRVDSTDGNFYYFGDHHLNEASVSDTVSLPSGGHELQIGVSYKSIDGHSCSGTADYHVVVTSQ